MLQEEMQKKENRKKAVTGNNVKVKKKSKELWQATKQKIKNERAISKSNKQKQVTKAAESISCVQLLFAESKKLKRKWRNHAHNSCYDKTCIRVMQYAVQILLLCG